MCNVGDIVRYHGCRAEVTNVSTKNNGFNIVYLEGIHKGWEDWVAREIFLDEMEDEELEN